LNTIDQAMALQREGQLEQAAQIYTHILQHHPRHADALQLIRRAIKIAPQVFHYHYNLGVVLQG